MREVTGNIWEQKCDWICITTNGMIKKDGRAVMGKGIAKQAVERYRDIDLELAKRIEHSGNTVQVLYPGHFTNVTRNLTSNTCFASQIISFPTKHNWRDKSDIYLIKSSAEQLYWFWKEYSEFTSINIPVVCLPRPGCGEGGLEWEEVREVIAPILKHDNFVVVSLE